MNRYQTSVVRTLSRSPNRGSLWAGPAGAVPLENLRFLRFLLFILLLSGCAHYSVNAPLPAGRPYTGYRFQNVAPQTNSDGLALMLAFSGGGTRAAALSYSVLEELKKTQVGPPGHQHPLLEDVGVISSVSGGSFTAACYALWGERFFSDFEPRFLKKHVQTGLLLRALAPWNQVRLASPRFSRSDLAAEYYDHLLFKGATFADLNVHDGRPFLSVNATDLGSGARFEFTQDEFDLLHSDLAQFPISRAVAASSAFTVYLTPVVLKNYSAEQPAAEPEWIKAILADPSASSRLRYLALGARSYADGRRRFIHLLDGGLSDNLGLRGALDRAMAREQAFRVPSVPLEIPRRIAIIVVDAHTDRDYGWDAKEHSLGLGALIGSVGQAAVSHYSFETLELFREAMARLSRERDATRIQTAGSQPIELTTYTIELRFNQLADESDRRFFNSVPTRLQLPAPTVDRLKHLAAVELRKNPGFQRLIQDLGGAKAVPVSKAPEGESLRGASGEQAGWWRDTPKDYRRITEGLPKDYRRITGQLHCCEPVAEHVGECRTEAQGSFRQGAGITGFQTTPILHSCKCGPTGRFLAAGTEVKRTNCRPKVGPSPRSETVFHPSAPQASAQPAENQAPKHGPGDSTSFGMILAKKKPNRTAPPSGNLRIP